MIPLIRPAYDALDFPHASLMVASYEARKPFHERVRMMSSLFPNLAAASGLDAWYAGLGLNRRLTVLFCLCLLSVVGAASLQAQSGSAPDGVTLKDGKVYGIAGGQLVALAEAVKLPFDVEVNPDGIFKVAAGKERNLLEGQIIRRDGWLVSRDGSVQPVFDHVAMLAGRVMVVRDGRAAPLTKTLNFPGVLTVEPDGSCTYTRSGSSRLQDGQLFRMDGTGIMAKDTATLINGKLVVQRGGSLINLNSGQIMGMNDGTRVYGDGRVERQNGTITQMREGQVVLFDGMPAKN